MLALVLGSLLASSITDPPTQERPWAGPSTHESFSARAELAAEPEERIELAEWCLQRGLFQNAHELLVELAEDDRVRAQAHRMLGLVESPAGWAPEESRRPQERLSLRLPQIREATRRELLLDCDREMKMVHSSSFFKLWSDFDFDQQKAYSHEMARYYRGLKSRLRASAGEKVDIYLYGSRSAYLRLYDQVFDESGSHVAGFFVPSTGSIFFYDLPYARERSLETARHECTHLLLHSGYGAAPLPRWLHEGMACYLAADGELLPGGYTAGLLVETQAAIRAGTHITLRRLLKVSQFGAEHYPPSWALIHFVNQEKYKARFDLFLTRLREDLAEDKSGTTSDSRCRQRTEWIFSETFETDLQELDREWLAYFRDTFALETPHQLLNFARASLAWSAEAKTESERTVGFDHAEAALAAIDPAAAPDLAGELTLVRAELWTSRLADSAPTPDVYVLGLRAIRDLLAAVPTGTSDARRGRVALQALDALKRGMLSDQSPRTPFDMRGVMQSIAQQGEEQRRDSMEMLVALFDDLQGIAAESTNAVLSLDPLHAPAVHDWLTGAMEFDPRGLEPIFPYLRMLVEVDPDDANLAALGVAYAGMGNESWGKMLMDRAREISPAPESLARFDRLIR